MDCLRLFHVSWRAIIGKPGGKKTFNKTQTSNKNSQLFIIHCLTLLEEGEGGLNFTKWVDPSYKTFFEIINFSFQK